MITFPSRRDFYLNKVHEAVVEIRDELDGLRICRDQGELSTSIECLTALLQRLRHLECEILKAGDTA